jgi:hypothetical protein
MLTATKKMMPLSFTDAFLEAHEEVRAYRLQGAGKIIVEQKAMIHLGDFSPGQDDTPHSERHAIKPRGNFSVMDGVQICSDGVRIHRLGIAFNLSMYSQAEHENCEPIEICEALSLDA